MKSLLKSSLIILSYISIVNKKKVAKRLSLLVLATPTYPSVHCVITSSFYLVNRFNLPTFPLPTVLNTRSSVFG